jgi:hypothetical protein
MQNRRTTINSDTMERSRADDQIRGYPLSASINRLSPCLYFSLSKSARTLSVDGETDISSEVLKAINPTVAQNAATYRQTHGVLTLSVITLLEIVKGCQQARATGDMQRSLNAIAKEEVLSLEAPAASTHRATWLSANPRPLAAVTGNARRLETRRGADQDFSRP